jgi:hypothetical protein
MMTSKVGFATLGVNQGPESTFSSTLVMDARVTFTERESLNVNPHEIPTLFEYLEENDQQMLSPLGSR